MTATSTTFAVRPAEATLPPAVERHERPDRQGRPDAGKRAEHPEWPDPRPLAENLARCVVEILAGTRELDQIARWLSSDVYAHLTKRVVLSRRARHTRGDSPSRPAFTMGSTVLGEPREGVVEAVVIVHGRARSRAVAIRLEMLGTRWRASAIHVL